MPRASGPEGFLQALGALSITPNLASPAVHVWGEWCGVYIKYKV
jgi:hypothetical protein